MYKGEPDIPVAMATLENNPSAYYPTAPSQSSQSISVQQQTTSINMGRSSRVVVPRSSGKHLVDKEVRNLQSQGYTNGLIQALAKNTQVFPLRIWVVDNSGSMAAGDGHRIVATHRQQDVRFVTCSR
jgi:hypothetical protein